MKTIKYIIHKDNNIKEAIIPKENPTLYTPKNVESHKNSVNYDKLKKNMG